MVMVNLTMPGDEKKCTSCHIGPKQESKSGFINGYCARCYGKSLYNNSNSTNEHPTNNASANGEDEAEDSDSVNVIINTSDNTNKIKSLDLLWDKISMLVNKNAHSIETKLSALSNKIDFTVSCLAACDRRLDEIYQRIQSIEEEIFESDEVENEGETEHENAMENVMEDVLESVMEPVMEPNLQNVMENVIYDPDEEEAEEDEIEYLYDTIVDHNGLVTEVAEIGYAPSPYEQQAPVPPPGQPVMQIPPPGAQPTPSYVPHTHAPPPFLVPPPQFIASQTAPPNIINYVPGPNGHIFQPNYQSYSPSGVPVNLEVHNLEPGPPTQEVPLYQPQGCTYYNPAQQQQQQQQQQSVPLRRPKAAIPILPPPENSRSRNRHSQQDQHQQEQMIQQQQHQEQLVQQQLQQHQQQLIQQQQQELQHQRQEKLKQQKMKQYPLEQKKKQLEKDLMLQEDDRVTVNDFRSSTFVAKDNQVNLVEEKLRDVNLNDQSAAVEQLKAHSKVDLGKGDEKEVLSKDETVSTSTAEEKFNNLVSHAVDNSQETGEAEDNSESNCSVQDDALINHVI